MNPRITFCLTAGGTLDIFLNEAGRRQLIEELARLDEKHDHFHFAPPDIDSELSVSTIPYRTEDKVLEYGKVLFRSDAWDKQHYPHVMKEVP